MPWGDWHDNGLAESRRDRRGGARDSGFEARPGNAHPFRLPLPQGCAIGHFREFSRGGQGVGDLRFEMLVLKEASGICAWQPGLDGEFDGAARLYGEKEVGRLGVCGNLAKAVAPFVRTG